MPLIQVARQQVHGQQPAPLQFVQDRQQGIAVLAARQAHQPFLPLGAGVVRARLDHAVLFDRLAGIAHDALAQLAKLGGFGGAFEQGVNF